MREFVTGTEYELMTTASVMQFQNVGGGTLVVKRAATQPAASEFGWKYKDGFGERGHLDDLYPTETGSLWARSDESTVVLVEELAP